MRAITTLFIFGALAGSGTANAGLKLASLFQDRMVLQRDMPIPVWGTADAGAMVTVEFAGQKKSILCGSDGKWMISLDKMPASADPGTMEVFSKLNTGTETMKCTDIQVGEVWICSGQSNMQVPVSAVPEIVALTKTAKNIRSFTVKNTVAFTEQDTCQGVWTDGYPNSAVAFSFAYFLEKAAGVPVGIILTSWGSSSIEAWMPRDMTGTVPHFKTIMESFDKNTETQNRIKASLSGPKPWSSEEDIFMRRQPNILYNAMMKPLAPYACRGLVWYQGERNAQSVYGMVKEPWYSENSGMLKYGEVLKQWILRYRKEWNRDDLNFLIVMLPGYARSLPTGPEGDGESPVAHSWAWMRESQLKALDLPHTGVANTIDLGDATNVHPKDKLPVGQRLALLAARNTLGQKIEAEGPVMKSVKKRGNKLVVQYGHATGLKTKDGEAPAAFWLADDTGQWVPAEAAIVKKKVVLHSPELENPLYIRYAFAGKPEVNLINAAGLPAYPFRTDQFKP